MSEANKIRKLIESIEVTESFKFYSSNYDEYMSPSEPGWYVAYKTESGDSDVVKVDREPTSRDDAQQMIEKLIDWEWENGHFYAKAVNYGKV